MATAEGNLPVHPPPPMLLIHPRRELEMKHDSRIPSTGWPSLMLRVALRKMGLVEVSFCSEALVGGSSWRDRVGISYSEELWAWCVPFLGNRSSFGT